MPHDIGAVVRKSLRERVLAYAPGRAQGLQDRLGHHGKSGTGSDAGDHRLVRGKLHDPFGHNIRAAQPFLDALAIGAPLRERDER